MSDIGLHEADFDEQPAPPAPMLAGTFAVYEDGQGGFVLVTQTEQHGVDRRHIPAGLVKMAMGNGIVGKTLGRFMS